MTLFRSALVPGHTWHRRYRPKAHLLRYRMLMTLIDLDEAAELSRRSRWFGYNRRALMSLRDRDHLAGTNESLRDQVYCHLAEAKLATGGRIQLLCMPRILGAVFNPLSVYFCFAPGGEAPIAVLYEVNNTFGQRHSYLLTATPTKGWIAHDCDKRLYVSPFMEMAQRYRFALNWPTTDKAPLKLEIDVDDEAGTILTAAFMGRPEPITEAALLRAALAQPFLMLSVLGAIHWEALKLWSKGVRLTRRPPAPPEPVSIG